MQEAFINKVREIIFRNLENEKFGVGDLAEELGLSRSQTLRKIKAVSKKSVNRLIREVRLEEARKFVENEDWTASEIAYKVGFSSPSYFTKCFLDYFGVTPGEYRKRLEEGNSSDLIPNRAMPGKISKRKPVLLGFILIAIVIIGYLTVVRSQNELLNQSASIAVLPFLDLSQDQDKDYLADGITEAITLELSRSESLRVISRGSSMRFKGEKKLYADIAKELDVNLLLEGSVLYDSDSLRVVVQLIEPFPKERHIWAESYDQSTSDILTLVSKISNKIAGEISSIVQPNSDENEKLEVNPEAFDLYLKARHLWNNQKTRYFSLTNALSYLDKSIAIDSTFASAYVMLAEVYIAINKLIGDNEERLANRGNARIAVTKALELDQALAETYFTSGNISGKFDWDWEGMKSSALRGLKLDPNNATGHLLLSDYYIVKGRYQEAINEALIAESFDPLNPSVGCQVAERYYIAGRFDKSIQKYQEVIEMNPDYGFALNGLGFVHLYAGEKDKAFDAWLKLQRIMGNDSLAWYYVNSRFEEGLKFYLSKAKKNTPRFCSNPVIISSVEMMMHEEADALTYLQIAYDYQNEDLPVSLTYPDFYPLHNNPKFEKIVHDIGLVFPN